jgi:hypothetical protein
MSIILGMILGFITYCITAGEEGDYSRSLRMGGVHIHHWMYLFIPLLIIHNTYIIGFCIGGIIQGLVMYSDAFVIFY